MNNKTPIPEIEQEILDTALLESDQLLARSLHDDERRRKRRRLTLLSLLLLGGVVMSAIVIGIMTGWLAVSAPVAAQNEESQGLTADELAAQGWKLWQQQNLVEAEKMFSRAVALDARNTNAWNGLGWSQFNSGKSEQALDAFEKCVALEPRHPAALNGLGQIYLMWKDYAQAEKYLLMAAPQAPAAHYGLARVYLLTGEFKKALPWAEKTVAGNSEDKAAKQMLAAAKAGKLEDDLRKLIEPPGKPKLGTADTQRAWQMFQSGRMETAERLFRRALKEDKENLSALNGLAFCLLNLGNHDQAKPLFEQCLAKEADAPGPMNGLARCLAAEGKVDEAITLWEKMAEKYPGPTAATTALAQTYLERKEYAKSAKYYKVLLEAEPGNKAYQRGLSSAELGLSTSEKP
ncbi:MAG: tetratricopeptide repeat protein [Planctomycetales bacterium]|nr:tetratricopeptide repeat protein [Planctomycetales bacterium]